MLPIRKHILLVTNVLQFLRKMQNQSKNWPGVQYPLKIVRIMDSSIQILEGELHPKLTLSMFCALSRKQHNFGLEFSNPL